MTGTRRKLGDRLASFAQTNWEDQRGTMSLYSCLCERKDMKEGRQQKQVTTKEGFSKMLSSFRQQGREYKLTGRDLLSLSTNVNYDSQI